MEPTQSYPPLIAIILLFALPLLVVALWDRCRHRKRKREAIPPKVLFAPESLATEAQQLAAVDHLATLPQFHRLQTEDLIDWHSGARITRCPCDQYPTPHLLVTFHNGFGVGIVTLAALGRFLAWQNAIATHFGPQSDSALVSTLPPELTAGELT